MVTRQAEHLETGQPRPREETAPPADPPLATRPPRVLPTAGLRQAGYAAILVAFAFSQSAGQMVADTKFDLVTAPRRFLASALQLWDPTAAFGQLQNQGYGYAWPMGPFFVVGELVRLPPWVVQRLWWAMLLCLAFFGLLKLAQALRLGTPTTQVLAAFAFVLTPRITTLLGGTSVEIWPMALAPWVLLPLVRASERGSVRRAAALSALVVATCGGVNAVAVAAVLPLGVLFILTRARGPRRGRLLAWWTLFTMLATAWWWIPLLLLGRYSVPFLDYIENATITTVPTDLAHTLVGESDWVAYFAGIDYQAGQFLATTPFLLLDAAAIVVLGLIGIALRDNPHRRFLTLGLLTGLALVGFGYSGDLSGYFAADRTALLDGVLAPLRNLHKFDVVLRIPLVLGLAHALAVLPELLRTPESPGASRAAAFSVRAMAVLALVALALPWAQDRIAPRQGVDAVPNYWQAAADYLRETDDGTTALELPASAFGVYTWGNTHDDVLQGLAQSSWAVRNVIPLAQPGNVEFLDAVTRTVESGRPSRTLAPYLAQNGVGSLVVRNDLDRFQTGAPDPSYVRAVLQQSPGLVLERSFGPTLGAPAVEVTKTDQGNARVINGGGLSLETGSIDVYSVTPGASTGELLTDPALVVGDPTTGLRSDARSVGAGTGVLAEDSAGDETSQVLTDGTRRRESNFAAVRWNESATMPAIRPYRLPGPEHTHRFLDDPERWQTTEVWAGDVVDVTASSSQAFADGRVPLQVGSHPGAALDGDPHTAWRSSAALDPTGERWQVTFDQARPLTSVTVRLSADSAPVPQLSLAGSTGDPIVVDAPAPGAQLTYQLDGLAPTEFLRITAAGPDLVVPGSFGISEVQLPGIDSARLLELPAPDDTRPVDLISLERDPDRASCLPLGRTVACNDALAAPGEDGDSLFRRIRLENDDTYRLTGTVSLRRHLTDVPLVPNGPSAVVDPGADASFDVARSPSAAVDGDRGTTWVAEDDDDVLTVVLPEPATVDRIRAYVDPNAPVARPTVLEVSSGDQRAEVELDALGRADLPDWQVSELTVRVLETDQAFRIEGNDFVTAPPGITELTVNRQRLVPTPEVAVTYPCGSGPTVRVGATVTQTAVRASVRDLVRGASVPFEPCTRDPLELGAGATDVVGTPSELFRTDSLTLTRV
ncbi:MAG TPA: alpha-(1-_3)-arabinofuranosyltransferase family protein, partial [Nocardioides sp.]|nr:alpha-(1->3)-arabinofuranosyltransferase family protein [Nocardioides sp.]